MLAALLASAMGLVSFHAGAQTSGPTDAQIASIVVAANQVDINAGKLAVSKGSAKEVKDFGAQMVTDHSGVNKSAMTLVRRLKVTPEANPTSASLTAGGKENIKKLRGLKGAEFDRAYIEGIKDGQRFLALAARCRIVRNTCGQFHGKAHAAVQQQIARQPSTDIPCLHLTTP